MTALMEKTTNASPVLAGDSSQSKMAEKLVPEIEGVVRAYNGRDPRNLRYGEDGEPSEALVTFRKANIAVATGMLATGHSFAPELQIAVEELGGLFGNPTIR